MEKIISLAKRRGFVFPDSEIYGGLQNSWDFGPLGAEMKRNIKNAWWERFVHRRPDMVGIDAALLMSPKVWEASGHLKEFSDPLVECEKCHKRFRADQTETDHCPECGGKFTAAKQFNLMLKTYLGAVENETSQVYFRPETAQGIFVNFKNILDTSRRQLPFGIAQIGKAFRNEITPGNFIFRTREFDLMEIEYFIEPPEGDEWNRHFELWREEMLGWIESLGIGRKEIHELEVPKEELAHYSKRTVDFEYDFPFGRKELYGLAYRGDFDLKNHGEKSGINLKYKDPQTGKEFYPHVIEPAFGVGRTMLAALCSAYNEEEAPTAEEGETAARVVMRFPNWLAPVKVAVLPLSKKEELSAKAKDVYDRLRVRFVTEYDETQSIGRRYRRQDEIGTPYCVTVDFDSLEDEAVTVRDRDTMSQERIKIGELEDYLEEKLKR